MHAFGIAADQVVPRWQRHAESNKPITAAMRQPIELHNCFGRYLHAVRNIRFPISVVAAAIGFQAQKPAGNIRERDLFGILVFDTYLAT